MGVKDVKKIMTKVLIQKTKPKNTILLSSLKRSSSSKKIITSNFKMGKQNSRRKGFIGSKKSGKLLQGSSTLESNPLRRMRKTRKLFSFKSKPTTGHYLGKIGKMNEEQIKEMVNRAIEIEETPYEERIPIKDEYLDVEFDLEGAIKKVKKEDKNRQIVDIEWSGQDIMP